MDNFSIKDICRILKECAACGVARLKLGDFEVEFDAATLQGSSAQPDPPKLYDPVAQPASEQKPEALAVEPELLEDMRRAQLMIDDPLAFEQEVIDHHLRRTDALEAGA